MKDNRHPDGLPMKASIQSVVERRFKGVRGINCRFTLGAAVPASLEIDRIIAHRLTGAMDLYSPLQGVQVASGRKGVRESDLGGRICTGVWV
jgi:hypothetical protein